jgi:thiol-disulfide isomerase/thioredoxin
MRRRADLQACPTGQPGTAATGAPLTGIVVPCLGEPGSVDLGAALSGRAALINIWASWCQPCRDELPVLNAYAGQPDAVPVIGINVRGDPRDALELLATLGVRFPSVTDPEGRLQAALRAPPVLPTTFVLRPNGSVERVDPPRVLRSPGEVRSVVADLLASPPG